MIPNPSSLRRALVAVSRIYVFVACIGLSALLMLALLDALVGWWRTESFSGPLPSIHYYANQPWTEQFIRDQDRIGSATVRYAPFTVWRRPPYASETVNVDGDGLRVVPGTDCGEASPRIWFFGGSTMWGTNSPDWGTIPAQFHTLAAEALDMPLCVRNFGESAWVSTQSVIALIQQLQRGDVPDCVVFYHGANDLLWAFGNSQPYQHAEYRLIASTFDRTGRGRGSRSHVRRDPADLLAFVAPQFKSRFDRALFRTEWPKDDSREALSRLARETVDACLENQRIVLALAKDHGFEAHFFWQPYLIFDRKPLAAAERDILKQANPKWVDTFRMFTAAANEHVAARFTPDFTDLSYAFKDCESHLYTDPGHVTPEANAMIARDIFAVIRPKLEARARHPSTPRPE